MIKTRFRNGSTWSNSGICRRKFTFMLLRTGENSCFVVCYYVHNTVLVLFFISLTVEGKLLQLGYFDVTLLLVEDERKALIKRS